MLAHPLDPDDGLKENSPDVGRAADCEDFILILRSWQLVFPTVSTKSRSKTWTLGSKGHNVLYSLSTPISLMPVRNTILG
jgi:hypothetical protein